MDPISAAASVFGVIGAIASVTSAATTFMRDMRAARKEMVAIKKELSALRVVLEILAEDFHDPSNTNLPDSVLQQVVGVAGECRRVVGGIGDCIRVSQERSGFTWARSGRAEIQKLQADLEVQKSILSVTLDLVSV